MEMDFCVEKELVECRRVETSSSLSKLKYENPVSASGSSKKRKTVTKMISRMFNIRDQCSRSIVVLLIISIFILIFGYYVLIKKLTASSQLSENLSLELANVVNRTKVMEALAIAQEKKLTVSSELSGNLSLELANVVNRTKIVEALAIAHEKKFTEILVKNESLNHSLEVRNKCQWLESSGGQIPPGAVLAGRERNGAELYVARKRVLQDALIPGKFVPSLKKAYIPWREQEIGFDQYEVLCNCMSLQWLPMMNGSGIPVGAFIAGEENRKSLYVGRAEHDGNITPGKVEASGVCFIPFSDKVIKESNFEIMVL